MPILLRTLREKCPYSEFFWFVFSRIHMFPAIQTNKRQMAMKRIKIVNKLKILVVADIELLKKTEQGWEDDNINHIYVLNRNPR